MDNELNVRSGAGTNNPVVCVLKKGGVYTIVDEKDVNGYKWGLLILRRKFFCTFFVQNVKRFPV